MKKSVKSAGRRKLLLDTSKALKKFTFAKNIGNLPHTRSSYSVIILKELEKKKNLLT